MGCLRHPVQPEFEEQDTSVWPIQKFSWRDLTLRRSRNTLQVRAPFRAKYEIVPVGPEAPGRVAVPPSPTAQPGKYKGDPDSDVSFAARPARPTNSA
jgi:hypothetical protein